MTTSIEIEIPYTPRALQTIFHERTQRWALLVCHRRFGKTVACINELLKSALSCTRRNPRYAYVAPFHSQAKQIAWDYLKFYSRPIPGIEINESELRIDYPNAARIRLYGADNPNALRGIYLDGVVLDEFGLMRPALLAEVIRPALADREGYAVIIGTPNGQNEFYNLYEAKRNDPSWYVAVHRASETGIVQQSELDEARGLMDTDQYDQEFECSFSASMLGAYYSQQMESAESENRIQLLPLDPAVPVHTSWDIGIGDSTAIWFYQIVGPWFHYIDYYEASGEGVAHYANVLKTKREQYGYSYGTHYAPHDIRARDWSADGSTRLEVAATLGVVFEVVAQHSVDGRIDAVRNHLPKCRFDSKKCKQGITALKSYTKKYDSDRKVYLSKPRHDWASHPADSFGYGVVGYREEIKPSPLQQQSALASGKGSWMGV